MVKVDYEELMRSKSDDGLRVYIDNSAKYQPEAVNAAIQELAIRGQALPEEEINNIHEEKAVKVEKERKVSIFNHQHHLIVNDENAPLLYSKNAIWVFSVFFMPLFGAVLMSMNMHKNRMKGMTQVLTIGISVSITAFLILVFLPAIKLFALFINGLCAVLFTGPIWNKYIGKDTKFRKREIWIPFAIGLFIMILYVVLLFNYT